MTLKESTAALQRYQNHRLHPGSFLAAVLSNDLQEAVNYADQESLTQLPNIVRHVFSNLPSSLCGSKAKFQSHLQSESTDHRA